MPNNFLRFLIFGDIVGPIGREVVKRYLSYHKEKDQIDFVIANGENATHGKGLSYKHYLELLSYGVDVITSGNHFYNNRDYLNSSFDFSHELRPYNFDKDCPLKGSNIFTCKGVKIRVTNLIGRVFLNLAQSNPFTDLDTLIALDNNESIHIVDFHAEATAEKRCLAEYEDSKITCLFGTHTHVQTNDLKILDKGTLFLTDVGMNAAYDSILGTKKEGSIKKTMTLMPAEMDVPRIGRGMVNAFMFDIDISSKKVFNYHLINEILELSN